MSKDKQEGPTPRTDAQKFFVPEYGECVLASFASKLERELAAANAEIGALRNERNVLQKICAERSDELERYRVALERLSPMCDIAREALEKKP